MTMLVSRCPGNLYIYMSSVIYEECRPGQGVNGEAAVFLGTVATCCLQATAFRWSNLRVLDQTYRSSVGARTRSDRILNGLIYVIQGAFSKSQASVGH